MYKKIYSGAFRSAGREPAPSEIARASGLSQEDVITAMEALSQVESLHQVIYQGDGSSIELMDKLEDGKDENEQVINRFFVRDMLKDLSPQEQKIILWRYFDQETQSQIARKLTLR